MKSAQLLLVLVLSSFASFAGTLRVPQDFPTVQDAVAASVAGDTILVSPGLYVIPGVPSTILPGTAGLELHDGTTLAGSGPGQTVLEFAGADAGIVPLGTATVKLLHLRKAAIAINAYIGSNITVTNVIITDPTGTNVYGIELNQGNSYTIHNNTIDNVHQTNDPFGTAIDVPFGGIADIQNNLLTSNTHGVTADSFSGGTYTYNDVFGSMIADWSTCTANGCTPVSAPANNISADPLYCPDFTLQPGSPAVHAGNPAILNPDGTRSDMGAYGGPERILPAQPCAPPPSCQVNVTRESQVNPLWSGDLYDHSALLTIGEKGCALTSLSMALNFVGAANNPRTLNQFMTNTDRDYDGLSVWWGPATRDATGPRSPFSPPKKFRFDTLAGWMDSRKDSITNPTGAFKELNDALCSKNPQPVIVGVRGINSNCVPVGIFLVDGAPGHYVLVTGRQVDPGGKVTYPIADPACASSTSLDAYNNEFSTRGIVTDPPGDISELDFGLGDAADILVVDPTGNRTGFDPISDTSVQDIPKSAYFRDALDNDQTGDPATEIAHFIQIFEPLQGAYSITITGLKLGTYTFSIRPFSQDGSAQPETVVSGMAGIGSTSTLQLHFASSPGSVPMVTLLATFQSTHADINNGLLLGLIDNQGVANSLSQKIQAAADAAARGQNRTKANILNAFKREVNAQNGKHITGVAVQVLLQDVDSLLSQ